MAFKNKITWSFTGYEDQASAEQGLSDTVSWFRKSFEYSRYVVTTSVAGTPYGWRATFEAERSE